MFIHRAVAAGVSKPLERLMNGGMCEAQNGEAVLKDVDEQTFARFCQWAYVGYYTAGVHCNRVKSEDLANQERMWLYSDCPRICSSFSQQALQ